MIINNDLMKKLFVFMEYYPYNNSINIELMGRSSDILPEVRNLNYMEIQSDYINIKSSDITEEGFSLSINNATNADDAISIWYAPTVEDTKNISILYPVTLYVIDNEYYEANKERIHNRFNIQNVDYTFIDSYDRIDERIWYIISKYHTDNIIKRNLTYKILNHFESRNADWYSGIINHGSNSIDNKSCIFASIEDTIDYGNNNIRYKTKAFICGNELVTDQSGYYDVFVTKD